MRITKIWNHCSGAFSQEEEAHLVTEHLNHADPCLLTAIGPSHLHCQTVPQGLSKGTWLCPCHQGKQSLPPLWEVSLSNLGSQLPDCLFSLFQDEYAQLFSTISKRTLHPHLPLLCPHSLSAFLIKYGACGGTSESKSASTRLKNRRISTSCGHFHKCDQFSFVSSSSLMLLFVYSTNVCRREINLGAGSMTIIMVSWMACHGVCTAILKIK